MFSTSSRLWKAHLESEITLDSVTRTTSAAPPELDIFSHFTHSLPLWGYAMGFTSAAPLELKAEEAFRIA